MLTPAQSIQKQGGEPVDFDNHNPSSVIVYYTRDYTRFSLMRGNRQLNEAKIKKLMKDIKDGFDLLKYCPIIVSPTMEIMDGQHRFYVAQKLKANVHYVIAGEMELHEIGRMNSRTEKWKYRDFLNCYIEQGIEDYKVLEDFLQEHKWPMSITLKIMMGQTANDGGSSATTEEVFQTGKFRILCLEEAKDLAKACADFKGFDANSSRPFIMAIAALRKADKYDHARMVEKYLSNPEELTRQPSAKDYLSKLEAIYNRHARVRETIF